MLAVGAVRDSQGKPIAHARIRMQNATQFTDANGCFSIFEVVSPRRHTQLLRIDARGFQTYEVKVRAPGEVDLSIVLAASDAQEGGRVEQRPSNCGPTCSFFRRTHTAAVAADRGLEHGRPELVVEVVSQSSRRYDRVTKLDWYASIGVPEYWLVDPEARTIERLVLQGSTYFIAQTATEGTFHPESCRGLEIPLDDVWAG
jgi:hypothetical protein